MAQKEIGKEKVMVLDCKFFYCKWHHMDEEVCTLEECRATPVELADFEMYEDEHSTLIPDREK